MSAYTEWLAIPAYGTGRCTPVAWVEAFTAQGHRAMLTGDDEELWIEIPELKLRGYVELVGQHVEVINFELLEPVANEAGALLESVATGLGWELYPDDLEQDDLDED